MEKKYYYVYSVLIFILIMLLVLSISVSIVITKTGNIEKRVGTSTFKPQETLIWK